MRVIITGAAGFLGSNLATRYVRLGHTVVGIDNFASSDRDSLHVRALRGHTLFTLIEGDVCDPGSLSSALGVCGGACDVILNFACIASPPRYQANPFETLRTSTVGVDNVLTLATQAGITVVHASTSEVYGDPEVTPQVESYWGRVNSFGERSCYDEGKRCAEAYCYEYAKRGTDVRVVRIFNTYGPLMDPHDGRAVSNFINQALVDEPITIHGDGMQTRSFCYVDDLVRGIMSVATSNPGLHSTPMNLGNPCENTVNDIATMVLQKIPESKSSIVYVDRPADDPCRRRPDIERARATLGWWPNVCLDTGLDRTIEYFKSLRRK